MKSFDKSRLPRAVSDKITGSCVPEAIGRSGDDVLIFENSVLKISDSAGLCREHAAMSFLYGRLNVPQPLAFEKHEGKYYLLMSKMDGTMVCYLDGDNRTKARLLGQAARQVLQVCCNGLPDELCDAEQYDLDAAKRNIQQGKVPSHGVGGFCSTCGLYEYLCSVKPAPQYFTHGDFCLPNILYDGKSVGFIDLGGAGAGGKWRDIAMCIWSMRYNFEGQELCGFALSDMRDYEREFFYTLQLEHDEQSINYYLLLAQLF